MVDSINVGNNPKAPVVNNTKANQTSPVPRRALPMPKDEVIIENHSNQKSTKKKTSVNVGQVMALTIGGIGALGTIVLAGVILKTSGIFSGSKLLEEIKKADLPKEVKNKLFEEYGKLRGSMVDTAGSKNYINEVLKLTKCFKKPEAKLVDINKAKEILDKKIIGMEEVKSQVIDYLKVRNFHIKNGTTDSNKLILCLDGPSGVGKTAIAKVIAESMDVPFSRIGLSGVDKATQIVGGERIWQGASPGKLIKAVQETQSPDSVILLDEIDKLGHSFQNGDPGEALLDVLEPKQCKNFTDNYLEFPFDLSNVNFIMTSNNLSKISPTLKDRIHIIKIPAYSSQVKKDICKLEIGTKLANINIAPEKVEFNDTALEQIVKRGLDDDGKISAGARKALENLEQVFKQIMIHLDETPNCKKLLVDEKFVNNALDKYKTPLIKTNPIINEASVSAKANAENTPNFITRMFSKLRGNSNQ